MNLCVFTGTIIRKPEVHYSNNQYYISLVLNVKNRYIRNSNNLLFAYHNIKSLSNLNYLYKEDQKIIFEGYIYKPQNCVKENLGVKNYLKQYLWIKLNKIY